MAYDTTLNLLEPSTVNATGNGSAKFLGRNRTFKAYQRVGGDVTGTSPTWDAAIQESTDGSTGWTTIATFPQVTAEMVGYVATTTPRYEVPGSDANVRTFSTTKDYVRVANTTGGTTPVFPLASVKIQPSSDAFKQSGRN